MLKKQNKSADNSEPISLKKLLLLAQQEYEREQEHRVSQDEFAGYLGVNRVLLSYWMSGRNKPSDENLEQLSLKLGLEVYDAVGKKRPNLLYRYVSRNWENLPIKDQKQIADIIAKHSREQIPDEAEESSIPKLK